MNSSLLYTLLAATTITSVLAANEVISLDSEVEQSEKATEQAVLENKRLISNQKDTELQFSPVEKLPISVVADNESQKQLVDSKQANKSQAEHIKLLLAENEKLKNKVTSQDQKLAMQASSLEDYKKSLLLAQEQALAEQEQPLEEQKSEPIILNSEVERVKETINQKPNVLNLDINPGPSDGEGSGSDSEDKKEDDSDVINTGLAWEKLSGSVEFGFDYEQDNETTKTLEGRLVLDYAEADKYSINSDLDFDFETEDGEDSEEEYRWQLQVDYNLDPENLVFARSDLLRSEYASYKQEDIFTVGYGRILFNANNHKLNVEVGPGYRFSVPNLQEDEDAVSIEEFIVRTRINYERIMSDTLQFSVEAIFETGAENNIYETTFTAQNRIYSSLFLVFEFGYKFTENVPVDAVNEEVSSGVNLLYAF